MSSMDTNLQEPPPEHCPGTESKEAGNATACQGNSNAFVKSVSILEGFAF